MPGFVADCLETLEEIALECKEAFLEKGGQAFHHIPCLNRRDAWIKGAGRAGAQAPGQLAGDRRAGRRRAWRCLERARTLGAGQ